MVLDELDTGIRTLGPMLHDEPLAPVCEQWRAVIKTAREHKKEKFQDDADLAMRFYSSSHAFQYENIFAKKARGLQVLGGDDEEGVQPPNFRMTANFTAEAVQLFGPLLYHRNPIRRVKPRELPTIPPELFGGDPMAMMMYQQFEMQRVQQRLQDEIVATLVEKVLNYTPNELDLKTESGKSIDEAIIKGRGIIKTEMVQPPGSSPMVGSFHRSVDHWLIDPDCENVRDAMWMIEECCAPVWKVEQEYQIEPGTLKGNTESLNQSALVGNDRMMHKRRKKETVDQIVYYKIWSRMGFGGRLKGVVDELKDSLEIFGDYVYLVIAEGYPRPLNIPGELLVAPLDAEVEQALINSVSWPIPFYVDQADPWPVSFIDFHDIPKEIWPMSHMAPAMSYQLYLNWLYSMQMDKTYTSHRELYLTDKSNDEEVDEAIKHGGDRTVVKVNRGSGESLKDRVDVLQHPPMHPDMWKAGDLMLNNFERATGLNEVLRGQAERQMRSAQEAALYGDMVRIRPDAMKAKTEDAMSKAARKEAFGIRYLLTGEDLTHILGQHGAMLWDQLVMNKDVGYLTREFEYRIEAGSMAKPNTDLELQNSNEAAQFLFPHLVGIYQNSGMQNPNAVNAFIRFWCKARQLDPEPWLFPAMPQPMLPPGMPGEPPTGPPQPEMAMA